MEPGTPAEQFVAALMQPTDLPTIDDVFPRPAWMADAACREYPAVDFFPGLGQSYQAARAVCDRCLVETECLEYALGDPELTGCWGGTTAKERNALRASHGGGRRVRRIA